MLEDFAVVRAPQVLFPSWHGHDLFENVCGTRLPWASGTARRIVRAFNENCNCSEDVNKMCQSSPYRGGLGGTEALEVR